MPDQTLHEIARETQNAVRGLQHLLDKQRKTSRRRTLFVIAVYVPISMIVSMVVSVGLVSTCFLGTTGIHSHVCQFIPSYRDTEDYNKQILRQFQRLIKITTTNDRRITRLEERQARKP